MKKNVNQNEEKAIIGTIIDSNTGEVIDYIYSGDKIVHEDEEKPTDKYVFDFNKDKKFVKVYDGVTRMKKKLTDKEFVVAMEIMDFVCYEDCILRNGGHKNGKILNCTDLAELLDMDSGNMRRIVNSLINKGILGKHKTGNANDNDKITTAITVNPYIYTRGTKMNRTILGLFENSEWQEIMG